MGAGDLELRPTGNVASGNVVLKVTTYCFLLCQMPNFLLSYWVLESLDWVGDQVLALLALRRNDLDALRCNNIIILITKGNIYVVLPLARC